MPKIVILGSCRYAPYIVLFMPNKVTPPKLYNTEEGYRKVTPLIHAAIDNADEVWVYCPKGIGEHTSRDLEYAKGQGKKIRFLGYDADELEPKFGWISQFSINKKGVVTLTIKTNEISQEELDNLGKSATAPKVKLEVI